MVLQFRHMHGGTWPADVLLTEIAFLNIEGSEADAISIFHHVMKCGPLSALRHCHTDDAAVALQKDCRLSLADDVFTPHANKHGHTPLTDVVPSRGVRDVLERSRCAVRWRHLLPILWSLQPPASRRLPPWVLTHPSA